MKYLVLFFFFIILNTSFAQDLFQQRPQIDWKDLDSQNFKILYPEGDKKTALRVLKLLEYYRSSVSSDYKVDVQKLTLILHDNSVESNGFVTLGPRRSEWYMTPALFSELGSTEWFTTLSIHEFRHVAQYQKMKGGFNRALKFLLGDTGLSLGYALSAPGWYFEGDAVVAETALSKAGRGRSAGFSLVTRSILLEEKSLDYETLFFPNYNHLLPSPYEYGYFSHATLRNKWGKKTINYLIDESIRDSYWPFTYYNSYPLVINQSFMDFHHESLESMHELLLAEEKDKAYTETKSILDAKKENGFTTIDQFKVTDKGIFLLKKDFDEIMALYFLENSGELKHIKDLQYFPYSQRASFGKKTLVYTQQQPVMRYLFESTSDLFTVDLQSGDEKRITKGKRLFQPNVSYDEKSFYALELTNSQYDLVELSLDGAEFKRFKLSGLYPSYPVSVDAESIYLITQKMDGQKSIAHFNPKTQELSKLTQDSWNQISNLKYFNGDLYYERDYQGKIEIMRLDLESKQEFLMTSSKLAARSPFIKDDSLYFLDYTRFGYELKKATKTQNKMVTIQEIESSNKSKLATDYIKDSKDFPNEEELKTSYSEKDFSRFQNLFNFHSWVLLPMPGAVSLEATSNNYLNTMGLTVGYSYSDYEEANNFYTQFHYMRFWPILSVGASWGQRRIFEDSSHEVREDAWEETIIQGLVTLPFVLNFNTFSQSLVLSSGWNIVETTSRQDNDVYEPSGNTLTGPTFEISYDLTKNMALRDINPDYGLKLKALSRKVEDTKGNKQEGSQDIYTASFFIPGFSNHHSIELRGSREVQKSFFDYRFETLSRKVRTSAYDFAPELNLASFDYYFPIAYPDLSFSRWYYLSRVYASIFYDYGELADDDFLEIRSSAGVDLYLESRFMRLLPLTFGIRVAQGLERGESNAELFLKTEVQF